MDGMHFLREMGLTEMALNTEMQQVCRLKAYIPIHQFS